MRYILLLAGLFFCPLAALAADEPEIVIELTGTPDTPPAGLDIWQKNAKALPRLLNGKTREEALVLITSVSTKDTNVQAANGTKYRLVQYIRDNQYRKLLFRAKEPQTFVALATDTAQSLDLFTRYQVDMALSEAEFLEAYSSQTSSVFLPVPNGQTLYRKESEGKVSFFLFEQGWLVRILTQEEADQLVKHAQEARQQPASTAPAPTKPSRPVRKALLSGGTLHDQMYMPRVIQKSPSSTVHKQAAK